ncbi:hypothetical protein I5535_03215 [Rhodobacteraceae bacterium F11138]|nr:hypothetical protein [Rhodobacteraceae bacterium F11138]
MPSGIVETHDEILAASDDFQKRLTWIEQDYADERTKIANLEGAAKLAPTLAAGSDILEARLGRSTKRS